MIVKLHLETTDLLTSLNSLCSFLFLKFHKIVYMNNQVMSEESEFFFFVSNIYACFDFACLVAHIMAFGITLNRCGW